MLARSLLRPAAAVLMALSLPCVAATATDNYSNASHSIFFDKGAEGWYWYHDPLPEEETPEEKLPELPPVPLTPVTPVKAETPPAPFSLAWVQKMLPKYLEKAWDNPSPENVEAYFLVQRFAIDRADEFAKMSQRVVLGNSAIDESMRRPLSSPGVSQANQYYEAKIQELTDKIAEHAGLWFFFKSDCRYCEAQAPILSFMEMQGIPIFAISIDGGELKSHKFKHTYKDAGHAAMLGVTQTPTIYMVTEEGKFDVLGAGVMALPDIKRRMVLAAVRNGIITEEEFQEAQPIVNPTQQRDLSKELPQLLEAAVDPTKAFTSGESMKALHQVAKSDLSSVLNEENFIAPATLISLVGKRKYGQLTAEESQEFNHAEKP